MNMKMNIFAMLFLAGLLLDTSADVFEVLMIYEPDGLDLKKSADYAIEKINTGNLLGSSHTISIVNIQTDDKSLVQRVCEMNKTRIDGIIDLTSEGYGVADLAKHLDAPVMTMKWTSDSGNPTIRPNPRDYMRSLTSLMLQDNATREAVMILYEKTFDAGVMIPYEEFSWFAPVYLKEIPELDSAIPAIMQSAVNLRVSEFVIASSNAVAEKIIKEGIKADLMGGVYHWFHVTKDLSQFTCGSCSTGQVLVFQRDITSSGETTLGEIVTKVGGTVESHRKIDLIYAYQTAEAMGKIIKSMIDKSEWGPSGSNFTCYFNSDGISKERFDKAIGTIQALSYTSLLGQIDFSGSLQNNYSKFDVHQITLGSGGKSTNVGSWESTTGLKVTGVNLKYLKRRLLRVVVSHEPPFVYVLGNGSFTGYSIDILKEAAERMNFDYKLMERKDKQYGVRLDNGTWNGMIGMITRGEADMALGAFTITAERETVVDFTIPYYDYAAIQILAQNPLHNKKGDQLFFLKAFTWEVWVTLIATITGTGFLICFIDRVSPFSFQNRLKNDEIRDGEADGKIFTIKESMWFVLGAYTQAGESFDPRSISCRVIVVGFWLFAYLMMAMYTANLAAQLTVAKLTTPPASLEEYAKQTTYKYSVVENTAVYQHFDRLKNAEAEIFKFWTKAGVGTLDTVSEAAKMSTWRYPIEERFTNMFNRMKLWGFAKDTDDALSKIKNDNWAIFMETPLIKFYVAQNCYLKVVGEPFGQRPYGIVLQNKSPLVKDLDLVILLLQRDRILEQLKVKWWSQNKAVCPVYDANAGLSLDTLGGAFIFFAIGIGIATIIFILEKIVAKIWGVEWAKAAANDATVVRPMGMMSTMNINGGSHISIRRMGGSQRPASGRHLGNSRVGALDAPANENGANKTAEA